MGSFSLFHWIILLAVILLVFGARRVPDVMGDFAKGIKAFKKGLREDDEITSDVSRPKINVEPERPRATMTEEQKS